MKLLGARDEEGDLENSDTHNQIEGKMGREKQRVTCLISLCKWMVKEGLEEIAEKRNFLKATIEMKMWKTVIAYVLE